MVLNTMALPTPSFGKLSGPEWPSCYIVGGGPSLRGFNFNRLRGQTVVAVNGSLSHLPWATAVVSADVPWIQAMEATVLQFPGERIMVASVPGCEGITWLYRSRELTLSDDPSVIHVGGTSGYAALNVAYLKKAKSISLLGFDYAQINQHWFSEYSWKNYRSEDLWKTWAKNFDSTLPQLTAAGVEVVNYSPDSRIEAFPKKRLEDLPI